MSQFYFDTSTNTVSTAASATSIEISGQIYRDCVTAVAAGATLSVFRGDVLITVPQPVLTTAQIAAAAQAAINAGAKGALTQIDAQSVRSLREFILAKFPGDPLLPPELAERNSDAAAQRGRIR